MHAVFQSLTHNVRADLWDLYKHFPTSYQVRFTACPSEGGVPLVQEPILHLEQSGIFPPPSPLLFRYCFSRPREQINPYSDCACGGL